MLQPLGDRVLCRVLAQSQISPGGIVKPDTADDRPHMAEVIAVGPDAKAVAVEDIVVFGKYAGVAVQYGDAELHLLKADELLAKVPADQSWTVAVTIDPKGAAQTFDLGRLVPGATVTLGPDGLLIAGALMRPVADDVREAITARGFCSVEAARQTSRSLLGECGNADVPHLELVRAWKVDAVDLLRREGQLVARALDDSAGAFGGTPEGPLGIAFVSPARGVTEAAPPAP